MKYDYLIIGQGLAGSILAYHLLKYGKIIAIIDERESFTASTVGAGLVNPITGPKMVKSWKSEILFPFLKDFYREIEIETDTKFFTERTIYRPFGSVEEQNDWYGRSSRINYQMFLKRICESGAHDSIVNDQFGGVEILGYVLNMALFIETMNKYLVSRCNYIETHFNEDDLEIGRESIKYHGIEAAKIIFCSGYHIRDSKYFGWTPLVPVKGELLNLKMNSDFETIYNRSCFIIPQGKGIYKAGSTYDRKDLTPVPTLVGKNEITKKLDALLKTDYEIMNHAAGIRPGTVTRKPLIGVHPEHRNLAIFNGMGTKGVSLAPFFGKQFTKYLEEDNNLDEEVDIKKYYSLYFKTHFSIGI